MMIAIAIVGIIAGFLAGYNIGFRRCELRIVAMIEVLSRQTSEE